MKHLSLIALAIVGGALCSSGAPANAQDAAAQAAQDEWCKTATLPSSIAVCSEPELRALALDRQRAYDEAKAKLTAEQQKALLADQNGWVKSYPAPCGLAAGVPPSLPLASAIKNCMAQAGRARIAYLRGYGGSPSIAVVQPAPAVVNSPDQIGPGFDCAKAAQPLARLICSSPELSRIDLLFNQAYQALRHHLDPAGQRQLQAEDVAFLNSVLLACGIPETGSVAGSPDCVAAHYSKKRSEWLSRLTGPAYEEARRPIEEHIALQANLQRLGFLPATTTIDGVYSLGMRRAIVAWQIASDRPPTGIMSDADAAVFRQAPSPQVTLALAPKQPDSSASPPRAFEGAGGAAVQLRQLGGVYRVPVRINDAITLYFTLDSGASDVLIPADVVLTLFRTETLTDGDFTGTKTYVLADGSKLPSARFVLKELRVGDHRLANVAASIGPPASEPLLGQSFLSRFNSWTLDNGRHALILTEH